MRASVREQIILSHI